MSERRFGWAGRLAVALTVGAAMVCAFPGPSPVRADETASQSASTLDRVIMKNGKVIEGEILEETDTTIHMKVIVAGISAPTTFKKSDILDIKRGAAPATGEGATPPKGGAATTLASAKTDASDEVRPNAARLYVAELKGNWGFDVSQTPLRRIFDDADRTFGDLIDGPSGRKVVDPEKRQKNIIVFKMNCASEGGYNSVFRAEELLPIVYGEMADKGRRVVFWVELAGGGAAFLPWVSPEMYFTSEGKMGGIGNLDAFNVGDNMVKEKLVGAFLGHAEGFAIKGGYADHLDVLRAMIRQQNWLAVRFEGGRPQYLTREPKAEDGEGWVVLSDNGEGANKDEKVLEVNDILILEADWAMKIGVAKGIADSVDDLAFALGVHRDYIHLEDAKGQRILDGWSDQLDNAIRMVNPEERPGLPLGRLWREFNEIQVQGEYTDRRRERGRKINLLRQIRSIITQFAEVGDPDGTWRAQIDVMLAQLQLEAEQDARQNRGGN